MTDYDIIDLKTDSPLKYLDSHIKFFFFLLLFFLFLEGHTGSFTGKTTISVTECMFSIIALNK